MADSPTAIRAGDVPSGGNGLGRRAWLKVDWVGWLGELHAGGPGDSADRGAQESAIRDLHKVVGSL